MSSIKTFIQYRNIQDFRMSLQGKEGCIYLHINLGIMGVVFLFENHHSVTLTNHPNLSEKKGQMSKEGLIRDCLKEINENVYKIHTIPKGYLKHCTNS